MTSLSLSGSMPNRSPSSKSKIAQKTASSPDKSSKPQRPTPKSARTLSHVSPINLLDHPEPLDLKSVVRHYAERETEALAIKTLQLAKRGHTAALAFVYDSLNEPEPKASAPLALDLGSITRLDEIADAQRSVISAATEGLIKPSDAVHYMKMLNALGEAIKNSTLQAEIDELRSYVHGA